MADDRVQIILEALDNTSKEFNNLKKRLQELNSETKKTGSGMSSAFTNVKAKWLEIAAVAGTVVAAVRLMEFGAQAKQAEDSFRRVAASLNINANNLIADLHRLSGETVDSSNIMQKASQGMIMGLSGEKLKGLMEASRLAARTWGQDVSSTFDAVVTAVGGGVKAMGPLVKMGLITKEQFELMNKAIDAGAKDIDLYTLVMANLTRQKALYGEVTQNTSEQMQKFYANINEIKEVIGQFLVPLINKLCMGYELLGALAGSVALTGKAYWDWIKSGFKGGRDELNKNLLQIEKDFEVHGNEIRQKWGDLNPVGAVKAKVNVSDADKKIKDIENRLRAAIGAKDEDEGKQKRDIKWLEGIKQESNEYLKQIEERKKAVKPMREGEIKLQLASIDLAEQERTISKPDAARERLRLNKELLAIQEDSLSKLNKLNDTSAWYAQADAIDETRKKILELRKALEEQEGTFGAGLVEGLKRYVDELKTPFQAAVDLARSTAQAMESAFSDFFFDVMQGKMKSMREYVTSFATAIQKELSKVIAKMVATWLIGQIIGMFSGSSGSTSTNVGTDTSGYGASAATHHQGGYIPRFHVAGLASDERFAINKVGERYITKEQNEWLTRLGNNMNSSGQNVNVVVNVENKTGKDINAEKGETKFDGENYIVGVVLKNIDSYGPIRHAIQGVR